MSKIQYTPNLPNDVSRCHDDTCPKRNDCRRYTGRNTGGVRVVHTPTFREGDKDCTEFIPPYTGPLIDPPFGKDYLKTENDEQ